jgi:hypothetical protein
MRKIARLLSLTSSLAVTLFLASPAPAQEGAEGQEVRRDPEGITGISPYMEALAKGRAAFTSGDHASAIAAFDDAIAKDGERVLAFILKAQTQLDKGDLAAATATADAGNGKKGSADEQSKLIFLQAELAERNADAPRADDKPLPTDKVALETALKKIWDGVKSSWSAYTDFVTAQTSAPNYSASANDRNTKVDARVKREKDFGEVRARAENK